MNAYTAPMLDKPIYYTEDNDILFAAPPKPRSAKRALCTGHMQPGDVAPVITVRLPVSLTPVAFVAYLREALPGVVVVDDVDSLSEAEFLNFQINALRSGSVRPITNPLTDDAAEAIENEIIGREQHDCRGAW